MAPLQRGRWTLIHDSTLPSANPARMTAAATELTPIGLAGSPFRRHNARAQCGKEPEGASETRSR